jgi:hypothetical protein
MNLSFTARTFITLVIVLGLCVFGSAVVNASAIHIARLAVFLAVACLAARCKVKLPGLTGSMSVNLPFILIAAVETSMLEALIVACVSNLVQCLPRAGQKFNLLRTVFNVCNMALAVEATRLIFNWPAMAGWVASPSLRLGVAAAGFFLVNTVPVAIVVALTEGQEPYAVFRTWLGVSQLTFPYFLASAGVAAAVLTTAARVGWLVPALILPVMLAFYYSYRKLVSSRLWADVPRKDVQSQGVGEKQGAALA